MKATVGRMVTFSGRRHPTERRACSQGRFLQATRCSMRAVVPVHRNMIACCKRHVGPPHGRLHAGRAVGGKLPLAPVKSHNPL